jgi:hypothetical protein
VTDPIQIHLIDVWFLRQGGFLDVERKNSNIYISFDTFYVLIDALLEFNMPKLAFTPNEMIEQDSKHKTRYPTLHTVLMVEDFLKQHRDLPMKISELRMKLPRQVMHQTLKVVLEYLWTGGKIIYGPKGVQWIYTEPEHLKRMMENSLEI